MTAKKQFATPTLIHSLPADSIERVKQSIASKIKIDENGCWIWQGSIRDKRYGRIYTNNTKVSAHRASYIVHKGEIPEGLFICHLCNVTACVNPEHLYAGTHRQNMADRSDLKGHRILTDLEVNHIRSLKKDKVTGREIADQYGMCISTIFAIAKMETYKDVPFEHVRWGEYKKFSIEN